MLRLTVDCIEGLYYWKITRNGELVMAGVDYYFTPDAADAAGRAKWNEYTGRGGA